MLKILATCGLIFIIGSVVAQPIVGLKGEFSIKNKDLSTGQENLILGDFNFSQAEQKLSYELKYPSDVMWVFQDTLYSIYQGGQLKSQSKSPVFIEQTVFHLSLTGELYNYGMSSSHYSLDNVEQDGQKTISTWLPPGHLSEMFGKVLVASQGEKLLAVIFYDTKDKIITKQFYEDYTDLNQIQFPGKVTKIGFDEKGKEKSIEVTTYKNVSL